VAIKIVMDTAAGLHYAHEKRGLDGKPLGIVHRDVTPHNVIVTYDGAVKLLDFGVAKAENRQHKTTAGTLKGKIPYMSPEQCKGESLDSRSDIFALGILLYELTTGKRLYSGSDGEFETMRRIVEDPPPKGSDAIEGYPPELDAILAKALAKNVDERYQSAQDMQAELEDFARENRLATSAITLSKFLKAHFSNHINAYSQAKGDERRLLDHLVKKHREQLKEDDSAGSEVRHLSADEGSMPTGETPSAKGEVKAIPRAESEPIPIFTGTGSDVSNADFTAPIEYKSRWPLVIGSVILLMGVLAVGIGVGLKMTSSSQQAATIDAGSAIAVITPADADVPVVPEPADAGTVAVLKRPTDAWPPRPVAVDTGQLATPPLERVDAGRKIVVKPRGKGELRIASSPSVTVFIDGKKRGATPLTGVKLSAGRHRLRLINDRFGIKKTVFVTIKPNKVTKKRYTFPTK
jgi:hypothetical protein